MNIFKIVNYLKEKLYYIFVAFLLFGSIMAYAWAYVGQGETRIIRYILPALIIIISAAFIRYTKGLWRILAVVSGCVVTGIFIAVVGTGFFNKAGITTLAVGLVAAILAIYYEDNRVVKIIILVALIVAGGVWLYMEKELPKPGAVAVLAMSVVIIVELLESVWLKKRITQNQRAYIFWLWPVWLFMIVGVFMMPYKSEPYDWKLVKDIYTSIETKVKDWMLKYKYSGIDGFNMSMSGFSDNGNVGGNLGDSNRVFFKVDAYRPLSTNLYLAGVTYDRFDGTHWKNEKKPYYKDWRIDTLETIYSVNLNDQENFDEYLAFVDVNVQYDEFRTEYFFTPLKLSTLSWDSHVDFGDDANSGWYQTKSYHDKYSMYYYQFTTDRKVLDNLIENHRSDDKELWYETIKSYRDTDYDYDRLIKHRQEIKDVYCEDVKLSDELNTWVNNVTSGCTTTLSRLRAIEAALREFNYTKNPGNIPDNVKTENDFLEYFILDKKEGYCTYFATAFTLLARAEGVPARYVQGFCVPLKNYTSCNVTGSMAHAWTEVYFEGVGWVPFEPTAGYEEVRYTEWEKYENPNNSDRETLEITPTPTIETHGEREDTLIGFIVNAKLWYLILIGCLIIIGVGFIVALFDIVIGRAIYKKQSLEKCYKQEIERCFLVLKSVGYDRFGDETLDELGARIKESDSEIKINPPAFLDEYQDFLYNNQKVNVQNIITARRERAELTKHAGKFVKLREGYYNIKTGIY